MQITLLKLAQLVEEYVDQLDDTTYIEFYQTSKGATDVPLFLDFVRAELGGDPEYTERELAEQARQLKERIRVSEMVAAAIERNKKLDERIAQKRAERAAFYPEDK